MIRWHIAVRPAEPTRGYLMTECDKHHTGHCPRSIWTGEASGMMWHWDGNVERPTISPSIDCQGGCGRHFSIIAGEVK